jgi:hypothetical protein
MEDDQIQIMVMPFKPYPEGDVLAILNALERPIVISVAGHLPDEARTELVNNLKELWRALVGSKEHEFMQITIRDIQAKYDLETGRSADIDFRLNLP